jgi:cell wall-associated NlpC family hydrolase
VRHFQRRHGLHVDGWIGPDTWHKLLAIRRPRHDAILQLGDVSPGVGRVQRLLQIPADHVFGRQTLHAVLAFQRHHGLLPDGRVGPNTWHALGTSHHGRPSRAALGRRALRIARGYVGVPYVWGGSTPRGFDCSGLVWYAFRRLGVAVPRVTYSQWWAGRHVSRRALRPGDLVFFADRSHVGIWAGHGWFLQAPHTGSVVHFSSFRGWYRRHYAGAVRITA